jgi:competence protein ComEC
VERLLLASLIAGAATAPLVAHHFGEFTPAGPIGNLLLVPLVETVTVPFGLAGAALAATLGPWAGRLPLAVAAWAARLVLGLAEGFRLAAPVVLTRMPTGVETAALMLGTGVSVRALTRGFAYRRAMYAVAAGAFALGVGSIGLREIARRNSPDLVVTFLDVGQGDSAVVELPGGHALLIDAGGSYDGSFDPGARIVEPFLRAHGILRLDRVVLSHPHPDHMGGLHRIVQRFGVDALWTSGDEGRNPDYRLLIAEANQRHVATPVPEIFHRGEVSIEPLGPFVRSSDPGGERIGPPEGTTVNDASLVLRISNGRRSVLFTGDLEAPGEGELRGRADLGQIVASDVLKVPHHGSRTSSTDELLDAARPQLAVMSLGWCNRFHFPRAEVIERYRQRGIRVLRTDLNGAVTVTLTPAGAMRMACERGCDSPREEPREDRKVEPR